MLCYLKWELKMCETRRVTELELIVIKWEREEKMMFKNSCHIQALYLMSMMNIFFVWFFFQFLHESLEHFWQYDVRKWQERRISNCSMYVSCRETQWWRHCRKSIMIEIEYWDKKKQNTPVTINWQVIIQVETF